MEMWPWGLLAARVIALATGVRALVEILREVARLLQSGQEGVALFSASAGDLAQTFAGPVVALFVGIGLWVWADGIADAIALRVEDFRDTDAEEDEADSDGEEESPTPPEPTRDFGPHATVVFGAVGVFLIADGLPSLAYSIAHLVTVLLYGSGTTYETQEGALRAAAIGPLFGLLRIAVGWWVFTNATRLYGLVGSRRAKAEPSTDA